MLPFIGQLLKNGPPSVCWRVDLLELSGGCVSLAWRPCFSSVALEEAAHRAPCEDLRRPLHGGAAEAGVGVFLAPSSPAHSGQSYR